MGQRSDALMSVIDGLEADNSHRGERSGNMTRTEQRAEGIPGAFYLNEAGGGN